MKHPRILLVSVAAVALVWLMPSPYRGVRQSRKDTRFLEFAKLDPGALAILKRACRDCHSNETVWPWYSRVPPGSWLLERDVYQARKLLNFSRWPEYGPAQGPLLLVVRERVQSGTMPPARYVALHPESRLNEQERRHLYVSIGREAERAGAARP